MTAKDTAELISKLTKYVPNQEMLLINPEPRSIYYLTLPDGIRAGIDSSPYRLHKDRPWLVVGASNQKVLLFATKTVHNKSDIDKYENIVPYYDNGQLRAVVTDETIVLSRQDFIESNPVYFGSVDEWLFALCRLNHDIIFGKQSTISNEYAEQLIRYIKAYDASIDVSIPQQVMIPAPTQDVEENKSDDASEAPKSPSHATAHAENSEKIANAVRKILIDKIRWGKIKRGKFEMGKRDLNAGIAFYDDAYIYVPQKTLVDLANRSAHGDPWSQKSLATCLNKLGFVEKQDNRSNVACRCMYRGNHIKFWKFKILDSDRLTAAVPECTIGGSQPLLLSAT